MRCYEVTERFSLACVYVFADDPSEARGKAYSEGRRLGLFDGVYGRFMDFAGGTSVRRAPRLDGSYRGRRIMSWEDPADRADLVREYGFSCLDRKGADCGGCSARDVCPGGGHEAR